MPIFLRIICRGANFSRLAPRHIQLILIQLRITVEFAQVVPLGQIFGSRSFASKSRQDNTFLYVYSD